MVSAKVKDFLISLAIASILASILFGGFFFRKQLQEFGYLIVGKLFPGPHVKVKGTKVKGFVDGKKINPILKFSSFYSGSFVFSFSNLQILPVSYNGDGLAFLVFVES